MMDEGEGGERYIGEQGKLSGEAAEQERAEHTDGFPSTTRVSHDVPSEAMDGGSPTYYDRPAIKEPVWIWSVPAYFYTGGISAGASLLGAVVQVIDRDGHQHLINRCRWVAAGGSALGTGLLIHDLGRPMRFLNMLRVFRPSSAMSLGSWTLAAATGLSSGAALLDTLAGSSRWLRRLGDATGGVAGTLSPVLATYTGVLLSDTSVPVWQSARQSLPVFFGASSVASATDVLDLTDLAAHEEAVTHRLGVAAKVAELAGAVAVERAAGRVEPVGAPFHDGVAGTLWKLAKVATGVSLGVSLLPVPARYQRIRRYVSALTGMAGAAASRFAIFQAGKASARDPRATFEWQREGGGGAEVHERSAITGPDGQRATG